MRIGIDLGGTKIEGIAIDEGGAERVRLRVPTPRADYQGIVVAVAAVVAELERQAAVPAGAATVGVGIPGTVSPATGLVKNANTVELIGHPLDRDLALVLGRPVRVANDANCFALSEATDGAAAETPTGGRPEVVFGVIIGTGTGAGIVVRGQLLTGINAVAGEWGHNPLPWPTDRERPGPDCYCGKNGCVETFLSGPGLARDHLAHGGEPLTAADIAALADAGQPDALATVERYEDRMARALATVINVLDPEVIVLGGGVSNMVRLRRNVPRLWGRYVFSDSVSTALVGARHGDSSGVRGAAWLWPRQADGQARA
jgi:fructokinase